MKSHMAFSLQDKVADDVNPDDAREDKKKKLHQANFLTKFHLRMNH